MIVEAFLNVIKYLVLGVISVLPTIPKLEFSQLDGVFKMLSVTDLIIDVRVLAACLGVLILVVNIQLIWGVIMWVVRKIPTVG